MRKKIDNRIRTLIENGVISGHRSLVVIVGDHGRDQVVILHHMLSKATIKARPSVLWCYKKELGFTSHRKKRMKQLQKKIKSGNMDAKEDNPFELFISSTNIRYTYYADTHKILGNTYGMCVLQDFEALSPNLLARTVETVEGGGLVVILLRNMTSLQQLYTMTMDVHSRFRTEAHQDVVGRFNERFILSLSSCANCMVIDDQLNLLPVSSHVLNIQTIPPKPVDGPLSETEQELRDLKESLKDTQPVGVIVNCCKTLDQFKAVLKFVEAISEKTLRSTVAMTAARGRGKSAALGLSMASAVAFGYSNIFVTAPSPENLKTMFEFVFKGFDALDYQEHGDYEIVQSTNPEFNKAIVRINIFREHRQTIQYIHPSDHQKLGQAELVCIDEAAAIPLPLIKKLMGPYLVFMCSTINGYEGTGRSLSLKLINQLRQQSSTNGINSKTPAAVTEGESLAGRVLHEVTLSESIRYAACDPVEQWLYDVLCLDAATVPRVSSGCPLPAACELYYVQRDTLFSYHRASEAFLQRVMSLYVASHYKNTPNDLQMLSDAPAHHVFVLLGPVDEASNSLPEVLCVLQVCLEGEISKQTIVRSLNRGKRASGDLIPWTISQQFQDSDFGALSGARIVRIATHPDYQGMGYGVRAVDMLQKYYSGQIPSMVESDNQPQQEADTVTDKQAVSLLEEKLGPRKNLPPLLLKLSERPPENLDYLGVSYGLTPQLLRFWKKSKFIPVYLRQTANELTGEHSCIMLKLLGEVAADEEDEENGEGQEARKEKQEEVWLDAYWTDFRRRFLPLLSYQFSTFHPTLALSILQRKGYKPKNTGMSSEELSRHFTVYDLKRLELYSQSMVDYHLIMDLLPAVARLFFLHRVLASLSAVQQAILLGLGMQHKSVDQLAKELDLPGSQILGLFNRMMRKVVQYFTSIQETAIESTMTEQKDVQMAPLKQSLDEELVAAAVEASEERKKKEEEVQVQQQVLQDVDLSKFAIKGTDAQWDDHLTKGPSKTVVSIKGSLAEKKKRKAEDNKPSFQSKNKKQKKLKKKS